MRVIAGRARGTRLAAPRGMNTRPTADRVREALFSIIQSRFGLDDARILDICSGTGSLGIEALSRGAATCTFIECDRNAVAVLKQNLQATRVTEQSELLAMDAHKALHLLASRGDLFDVAFFDPPYDSRLYATVPEAVGDLGILAADGLLVVECAARKPLPDILGRFRKNGSRIYGDTTLEFYVLEGE